MEGQEIHHHLPEEIIAEILSKLSVKSLLRFKCVSKSWRCLISSKYFIKSYLENPKKNENFEETTRIISAPPRFSMPGGTIKACSLSSLLIKPVTRVLPLDFPINIARDILIVGSCNGLICVLVVDNYQFFLWNPCMRECKQLPDFFDGVNHNKEGCFTARHGFAFDESSGDYKIYVVFCMRFFRPRTSVARLYSLKADSWGRVESVIDGSMFDSGKFVSGKLHWRRDFPTESDWEIVTLDLKSETFGVVKQPNCLMDYRDPRFGILKGCLCLYFDYPRNTTIGFDIWIWNEYGVEDSWSRLLTISYLCVSWRPQYSEWHLATITPLFVSPNDEVLFTCGSNFFIYNPKDNWVRKLDTVDYDLVDHRDAHVHTDSLVSLALAGGGGGEQGRQA